MCKSLILQGRNKEFKSVVPCLSHKFPLLESEENSGIELLKFQSSPWGGKSVSVNEYSVSKCFPPPFPTSLFKTTDWSQRDLLSEWEFSPKAVKGKTLRGGNPVTLVLKNPQKDST